MRILVTRPEPAASQTATKLMRLGHQAVVSPVLVMEALKKPLPPGHFDAIAITSANAIRALDNRSELASLRRLPLWAVGEQSAEAARDAGFEKVVTAGGDASALARLLTEQLARDARVLYLAGEDRAFDLAAALGRVAIEVETLAVYRMRPADGLAEAARNALAEDRLDAVLHYSARSVETFIDLIKQESLVEATLRLRHYCLSGMVAAPLHAIGARPQVAERSDEASLLVLLDS